MERGADRQAGQIASNLTGWRYGATLGAIALACFLSAWLVRRGLDLGITAYPVWAPAGIALGAVILLGYRVWPGVALGTFWFALSLGASLPVAAGAAFGSTLEPITAQWMLEKQEFQPSIRRLKDVLNFLLLAVFLAPALNATTNTLNSCLGGFTPWADFKHHWWTVWLGDGMGILIFTPVLLHWLGRPLSPLASLRSLPGLFSVQQLPWRTIEAIVWGILLVAVSLVVFTCTPQTAIARYPLEYLPFPLLMWAALRLGQRITVLGNLTVSLIAITAVVLKVGPFIVKANDDPVQAILFLQAFLGVMTVTALVLSTAVAERWDSEERFRSMFERAAIGIGLDDTSGRIIESNPALQAMLGYSQEELQQLNFSDFTYVEDRGADLQLFAEMLAGRRNSYQLEKRQVRKNGQTLWVRLTNSIVRDELGHPRFTIGMVENISDQKQAEAKLQQAAGRERLLTEMAQRIRRSLDLSEILNTTVAEVRQFLGADRVFIAQMDQDSCFPVAESVDPAWNSVMGWRLDRSAVEAIQQLFTCDQNGQRSMRVVNNTQEVELTPFLAEYYRDAQLRASISAPIVIEGDLFGVLLINQCSSPRQWQPLEVEFLQQLTTQVEIAIQQGQLYQKLQQLATSLEEQVQDRTTELKQRMLELQNLNQVKDLLLHAVSHDLKTPIQGTLMLLDRLLNKCCSPETNIALTRPMAEQLLQSTRQQLTLLNCLIEQQQDGEPPPVTNWQPVQVATHVQTLLSQMQPLFEQNQVHLVNHLSIQLPKVKANPSQIGEVFQHLLHNAIKHNPPGVTVTLSAAIQTSGALTPTVMPMLCCTVTDDGVGITPEQCDRLFKLYIRSIDNPHLTGIGLGLHQCRQIIRAHGGQIGVTSEPNHGASFWFTLPIIEDREERSIGMVAATKD